MRGSGRRRQASVENGDLYVSGLQPLEDQLLLGQEETPSFASLCGLGGGPEKAGLFRWQFCDKTFSRANLLSSSWPVSNGRFAHMLSFRILHCFKTRILPAEYFISCIPSVAISVRLTLLIHNFVISPLISFNLASLPWCKVSAPSSWNATPFIWTFHVIC